MTATPLDLAHAAMEAAPDDDALRLAFWGRFAATEVYLALAGEAAGEAVAPQVFDVEGARYVLAFDAGDRLADFAGGPADHAAMPGRALVAMLAGQGIGLMLNAGAVSAILMPAEAVDWLAATLAQGPDRAEARPVAVRPPALPDTVLRLIDERLAAAAGLARTAHLVAADWDDGRAGHLLVLTGTPEAARPALARALSEALTFAGAEATGLDIAFREAGEPGMAAILAQGLRFDLPEPALPAAPAPPGSDPDRPPRLR